MSIVGDFGIRAIVRRFTEGLRRVVRGTDRFLCQACGQRVQAFRPLPEFYYQHLREVAWPYTLDAAETCNHRHYTCPHCGAADRDRLIALYLDECFGRLTAPSTLIDFAPSEPVSQHIRRKIEQCKLDVRYRTADLMMPGVDDRVDICDMSIYPNSSVDLFLCSHVLEHVPDDRQAMRELCRILKPGGRGLLLVPIILGVAAIDEDPTVTDPRERWRRFGQDDHIRMYSKQGFVDRLRESGFVVHQLGNKHFGRASFKKQAIRSQSVLYVVEKMTRSS